MFSDYFTGGYVTDDFEESQLIIDFNGLVAIADEFLKNDFRNAGRSRAAARLMAKYPAALEAARMRAELAKVKPEKKDDAEVGDDTLRHFYKQYGGGSLLRAAELMLLGKVNDSFVQTVFARLLEKNPHISDIAKFRVLNHMCEEQQKAA